jgi:hypothetical protein
MPNLKKLFARYIKEKKESDHAKLSASGSERWLGCPGSVRMSLGIPSVDNAAGIRGTNTHTLLQFILENKHWRRLLQTPEGLKFLRLIEYDSAMLANALFAAKYVWKEKAQIEWETGREVQLFTERKVELSGVGFGTSDVILFQPYGVLHVMDYKNGTKTVEPEGNTQALYYMTAAADEFGWEFSYPKITIIQPNAPHSRGHIRTWEPTHQDIERGALVLRRGAKITKRPDAPLVKNNEWCWFCPARENKCPLQMDMKQKKLLDRFQLAE